MPDAPLTWEDFEKVDMRIGTIQRAEVFAKARKPAYKLWIDFGPKLGIKKSSAQITQHYQADALIGQQVVAVLNFPPKQVADFMSEVLVLGAVAPDGAVTLLMPTHPVANGWRIA